LNIHFEIEFYSSKVQVDPPTKQLYLKDQDQVYNKYFGLGKFEVADGSTQYDIIVSLASFMSQKYTFLNNFLSLYMD